MKDWVASVASVVAAIASLVAVWMAFQQKKDARRYAQKQLEAQNMGNRLAKAALDEARKSPERKRADDMARVGGLPAHAKYLATQEVPYYEVLLDDVKKP